MFCRKDTSYRYGASAINTFDGNLKRDITMKKMMLHKILLA